MSLPKPTCSKPHLDNFDINLSLRMETTNDVGEA